MREGRQKDETEGALFWEEMKGEEIRRGKRRIGGTIRGGIKRGKAVQG